MIEYEYLKKIKDTVEQIGYFHDEFIIGGSLGLYLQGVQERIPNDIDIIIPFKNDKIIKQFNYDFGLIYLHEPMYISDPNGDNKIKIDTMSIHDNYWKITKYFDVRIMAYVQNYPQIHYCIQYAITNELTSSPSKRIEDLRNYNLEIENYQKRIKEN